VSEKESERREKTIGKERGRTREKITLASYNLEVCVCVCLSLSLSLCVCVCVCGVPQTTDIVLDKPLLRGMKTLTSLSNQNDLSQ